MSNKKGFTLIELMVVISILAILATVALPTYNHYRHKADIGTWLSAVAANSDALQLYYLEHGDLAGLNVAPEGGRVMGNHGFTGVELPKRENMSWSIQTMQSPTTGTWGWCVSCKWESHDYRIYADSASESLTPTLYYYTDAANTYNLNTPGVNDFIAEYGF